MPTVRKQQQPSKKAPKRKRSPKDSPEKGEIGETGIPPTDSVIPTPQTERPDPLTPIEPPAAPDAEPAGPELPALDQLSGPEPEPSPDERAAEAQQAASEAQAVAMLLQQAGNLVLSRWPELPPLQAAELAPVTDALVNLQRHYGWSMGPPACYWVQLGFGVIAVAAPRVMAARAAAAELADKKPGEGYEPDDQEPGQ